MRYIPKRTSNEPDSLKAIRLTNGAAFDDCNKQDIREILLSEQGHLCAYCMRRIDNSRNKKGLPNTRIEHYETQATQPNLQLSFINMLGVCDGNEGNPKHLQHCDKKRTENKSLTTFREIYLREMGSFCKIPV